MNKSIDLQILAKSAIPLGYAFCLEKNCVQGEKCLRSTKFKEFCAQEHRSSFCIVNPEDCNPQQKNCINFRSAEPAPYAFGFTNEYQKMNLIQKDAFKHLMIGHFCKTLYYDMKRGDRIITPEEQKTIISLAKKAEYNFPPNGFDRIHLLPGW